MSQIDGCVLGQFPAGDASDVDLAVTAAKNAFPGWAALGAKGRAGY